MADSEWLTRYETEMMAETNEVLQLMEETWGYKPDIKVELELRPVVKADFNIAGFAHDARKQFINPQTRRGQDGKYAAREYLSEITDHRNFCKECGEGIAQLYQRLWYWQSGADPYYYHPEPGQPKHTIKTAQYPAGEDGRPNYRVPAEVVYLRLDVPPDAVELRLAPRQSLKTIKAMVRYYDAHPEEIRPLDLPPKKQPRIKRQTVRHLSSRKATAYASAAHWDAMFPIEEEVID